MKKILVGFEESQVVCKEFRNLGYEAYSCDLVDTRGNQDWHYKQDIMTTIPITKWDLIILHPDCTAMAVSGNRWYGKGMTRYNERLRSIKWTKNVWNLAKQHSNHVALENPVSVIFSYLPNVHYIQPWQFGHGETKKTGFALYNLPPLRPTNIVDGRENRIWKMPPSKTRKRDRSVTFVGVAKAMAKQWGDFINI